MMKAVIIDDEENSAESLKILIRDFCEDVDVVALASTGDEAIEEIERYNPDVIFLDINLQYESGFDLLARMEKIDFAIIFTTAYSEYAIKAFRFSALDYLLKPIDIAELQNAIAKVKKIRHLETKAKLDHLIQHLQSNKTNQFSKLAIPSVQGLTFIAPEDVVYCEARSNYTEFHLVGGVKHLTSKTLKDTEAILNPDDFVRIHNSYIINLRFLKKYNKGEGVVVLDNNVQLDVSKRRKDEFLRKISCVVKKETALCLKSN